MASPQHSKPQFTHPPTDTVQPSNLPTANRLVNHLIAAKRSLSATSQVYRANEIIPHARTCVEEITALSAKNAFLEHGIQRHLKTAVRVRRGLEQVKENGAEDFKVIPARSHMCIRSPSQCSNATILSPSKLEHRNSTSSSKAHAC